MTRQKPQPEQTKSTAVITWELSEEQVEQLTQVLDIATKAMGLNVAKVTVSLMDSLMQSVQKASKT